jgi:hypothetical protein
MAIRRINSTGRKKILREDASIALHKQGNGSLSFDAKLDLSEYDLPPDANVYVEAYRQTNFMRFDYGTVATPRPPLGVDHALTEFASKEGLLFRVKVTSVGDRAGLLLAEGDGIPCREEQDEPDKRLPLLPAEGAELGQEVWRISFTATGPFLQINRHVGDWKAVGASPMFRSLVFPSAIRQVLAHILLIEKESDFEDMRSWQSRWLAFAVGLGAGEPPQVDTDDEEALDEWIDGAAERFCATHSWLKHYVDELRAGHAV